MSLAVSVCYRSGVLTAVIIFLWISWWIFFGGYSDSSAEERLVVSKVDIGSCPLHYLLVVHMLSKLCSSLISSIRRCAMV